MFSAFHTCSLILCFPFTTECTVDQVRWASNWG